MSTQLYILKDENERLRQIALNYDEIERMKQENKEMRLELQKLKNVSMSEIGGGGNSGMSHNGMLIMGPMGDQSPKSFDGRHVNGALT